MGGSSCGVKALRDMLFNEKATKESFLYSITQARILLIRL